ncbi:hypothetical protein ILYODFUR_006895 [Ilyodon furcidens]|uniref:Uncharacterized protein n=1 Tax=Ilyodon furcidens TaxID=33524 RepID=A0ABV0SWK5_9TELE
MKRRKPHPPPAWSKRMRCTPSSAFIPKCHCKMVVFIYIFILGKLTARGGEDEACIPQTAVKPVRSGKEAVGDFTVIFEQASWKEMGGKTKKETMKHRLIVFKW